MTRGPLVVLGLLASVGAITGLVLIGFVLMRPEAAPCARGELAENPTVQGVPQPREERFETVREAEAFICHGVPHPAEEDGWQIESIAAERSAPLELTVRGLGTAIVHLEYTREGTDQAFVLSATPLTFPPDEVLDARYEVVEATPFLDGDARVRAPDDDPTSVLVEWRLRNLNYRVSSRLSEEFGLGDLLAVLETLE